LKKQKDFSLLRGKKPFIIRAKLLDPVVKNDESGISLDTLL
jgi:hypothetical protein